MDIKTPRGRESLKAEARAIAEELGCPLEIVLGALKEMNVEDPKTWIGDPFATINS